MKDDHMSESDKKGFYLRTALLCASTAFLFADQNLMAPNLSAIAEDFGFDDVQRDMKLGGQIPFAFFVVGGAISLVIGPMADWMDRAAETFRGCCTYR
jgi:MFS family permease